MTIQGGAIASKNGKFFERKVIELLVQKGFFEIQGKLKKRITTSRLKDVNGGMAWVSQQVRGKYKNLYGGKMVCDIVGYHPSIPNGFIMEMKTQNKQGSVDEKYAFTTLSLKKLNPLTIIVFEGEGAKPEAVKWMKSQADINHKFMNFYSASTWLDELFN